MMNALLLLLASASFANELPMPGNLKITPAMLRYKYIRFDGAHYLQCEHKIEDAAAQDWRVVCADPAAGFKREYRVHLWVTLYTRAVEPRNSYEVLYWVTDLSQPGKTLGTSTTLWFHLKDPSALHSITVSQSVENDAAGLYLDLDPSK